MTAKLQPADRQPGRGAFHQLFHGARLFHPPPNPPLTTRTYDTAQGTAAGIYGIIVGAAVMAASHAPSAVATVVVVLVTLLIYWLAERFSRIVAERIHEGHRPAWHTVREQLTSGWELITTSMLPLAVLVLVRLQGGDLQTATFWSLMCSTTLLCAAGWRVGCCGRLSLSERLVSTGTAGVLGVGLVLLETLLH